MNLTFTFFFIIIGALQVEVGFCSWADVLVEGVRGQMLGGRMSHLTDESVGN